MTYGQITLTGIRAHANHGVLASERELGQPFSVDVSLDVDMDTVSDDLTQAVNYATVAQRVLNILTREPVSLIAAPEPMAPNRGPSRAQTMGSTGCPYITRRNRTAPPPR